MIGVYVTIGVKNRVIATEVLDKYRQIITDLEGDIAAVITSEKTEKNIRVAEEQTNRAANLMKFQDEIHSRPARTWFQVIDGYCAIIYPKTIRWIYLWSGVRRVC
jgi:hypothetical protein